VKEDLEMQMVAEKEVEQFAVKRDGLATAQFGRFCLHGRRRELLADGVAVPIGSRALDILLVLMEARGELVTKDELMDRVWPNTFVEENTLHFQISAIRKVLGEDRDCIKTIAGRGYRFVSEITDTISQHDAVFARAAPAPCPAARPPTNLWAPTSNSIGREAQLRDAADLVRVNRLVTLVGIGGTGKTHLGIELARHLLPEFADGVWIVELGAVSNPDFVLPAIAATLGVAGDPASPGHLVAALASRRLLVVLDNCEHVIDTVAYIAEAFLQGSATVQMIATSREPLRVNGECISQVSPLDVPAEDVVDFDEISQYGAVKLFIARARAAAPRLSPDERFGAAMAKICRRVDGIPLAIELAASRAAVLGIEPLAAGLDQGFDLLTGGRRTAMPRHQTLRATLDWSHALLTEAEQVVLRRLAIFAGGFRLDAASGIAANATITRTDIVDCFAELVMKSLVSADMDGSVVRYRLLETTRAYMLEKLAASGERNEIARRHAEYYRDLFQRAAVEPETRSAAAWMAAYGPDIDNMRAALDWASSPSGNRSLGVALAIASAPEWSQFSRVDENRGQLERAVARLDPRAGAAIETTMPLLAAHALPPRYAIGHVPDSEAA
jgi:predicted ATPase/DNA-binding winged helix-turn-helix (wHTH) protein